MAAADAEGSGGAYRGDGAVALDVPNDLWQVGPGGSEEADRWDPAAEFFSDWFKTFLNENSFIK
jgi:hypothetical protein